MALLTANAHQTTIKEAGQDNLKQYDVGADVHIWKGGFVGIDPAGNAKAFQAGDILAGIAYTEADNTATGNAAGDITVKVQTAGDFVMVLSGAAKTDHGRSVFATTDNQNDVSFVGGPDGYVGFFVQLDNAGTNAIIRMDTPGRMPFNGQNGRASLSLMSGQESMVTGVGVAHAEHEIGGFISALQLGGGITDDPIAGAILTKDAVAEITVCSLESKGALDGALGMRFEGDINVENLGDASVLDFDWGFVDEHLEEHRESMITCENRVLFHMDTGSANILAESDDQTTVVAPTDTTIDNVTSNGSWKNFIIIVRTDGVCELWIAKARVLTSIVFAINPAIATYRGVVNQESTSDDTLASTMVRRLRITGVAAH